ncbi:hypothetical protein BCR35DRAFT_353300 [Leucosporidium creatinivorum]|uniref:F-box domain-containing protein n=1 Tax=Leucosporidium creatinivorum TaxID=106004 RepID=A0A1Y2F0A8_9BASI|nr:hypothetical protein BCR35DRAFT_353300 [Leucosporidium creatinivorum]
MNPPLPTEILHPIIKFSLPIVSFRTYRARYRLLLVYSLVNSTWRALAKKELYEELFVKDLKEAAAALSAEGACEAVKRIHYGLPYPWPDSDEMEDLDLGKVELPRSARELRISGFRVNGEVLPSLAQLETLHLRWCDLGRDDVLALCASPPYFVPPPPLHSLSTLSLGDPYLFPTAFPSWTAWFSPATLPSLSRLSIALGERSETVGQDEDFRQALSLLAPQLTSFSLAQGEGKFGTEADFPWTKFTTLSRLALFPNYWEATDLLQAVLQGVPGSVSALRIGDCRDFEIRYRMGRFWQQDVLEALATAFVEGSPSLQNLQVLSIDLLDDDKSDGVDVELEKLHQVMAARGGSLEYRLGWEGEDELLDWERFVEPW